MCTSSAKSKVALFCEIDEKLPEYQQFLEQFELVYYTPSSRDQLIQDFKTVLKDVVAIYGGWDGFAAVAPFDSDLVAQAPPNLKIIALAAVGYDRFDLASMRARGITLTNVPSLNTSNEDVADIALFLTLSTFRYCHVFASSFKKMEDTSLARGVLQTRDFDYDKGKGGVDRIPGFSFGHVAGGKLVTSPRGKNAAVVGFGAIGRSVADRLSAIGMNIHYTKRTPLGELDQPSYPATYHDTLQSALAVADVVILCAPGIPENYHLINKDTIEALPERGSRIINVGRGSLVDEKAVLEGLKSGRIISVGFDVYEKEPLVDKELLERDDVVLLPHIGSSTTEVFQNSAISALKQITDVVLNSKVAENIVNP